MKETKLNEVINQLNSVKFKGLEAVKMGDALYYALFYYKKKKIIYEVKTIFAPLLKGHYVLDRSGNDNTVFFYSSAYADRNDHREKFDKVTELIKNSSIISYHYGICLKNMLYLPKIISIFRQIKQVDVEPQLRRFIAYWIYSCICEQREIRDILLKNKINMKVLTSYCDVMSIDSMLIQYYKDKGITTITLQHGQFNIGTDIGRAAYEKSYSNYFLCFGEFTKFTCRKLKVDLNRLIPLGPPEMIGKKLPVSMRKSDNRSFGVVMSFFEFREENIRLLECADAVVKRFSLTARIRLHPSLKIEDYRQYINEDMMKVCDGSESMDTFIKDVDFAIVGASSVFQTFIIHMVPIYRYIVDIKQDPFNGIDWCAFSTVEKGIEMIEKTFKNSGSIESRLLDTRRELIGEGDIAHNYVKFYENLADRSYKNEKVV